MILFFMALGHFLQEINQKQGNCLIDEQSVSDFFERIEDVGDISEEVKKLLKNRNIASVCEVGKLLFTLLPNLERKMFLIDDSIELINRITFNEDDINSLKKIAVKYSVDNAFNKKRVLIFENFKQSLMLANEILFLYKKNDEAKCDITERLKNVDDAQSIFSALLHYLEFEVIQEKVVFDKNLVIRELQKGRFILSDVIKYIEFIALLFDYDECE